MKSLQYFIVSPKDGKRYTAERKGIIISTSKEDHLASTREAIVLETPYDYDGPIQKGDTVIVHHNTFKYYYDMRGAEKSSWNYFRDDIFLIDDPYAYRRGTERWRGIGRYVFVAPIKNDRTTNIITSELEKPLLGEIRYINQELEDLGLKVGDVITFEPESEYPFHIDGEKVYRMYTKNITIKL
jgi:co-chaperonin GroES (HSP10)